MRCRRRRPIWRCGRHQLGQAEIQHLGLPALGQKDIRRLEVAMNDSGVVGRFQRVGDLDRNLQDLGALAGAFP